MKVLYLDHPEADYLSSLVFLGLCQTLGADNVVDWPWMPHFHGQVYEGPVPSSPRGTCAPAPWMAAQGGRPWSDDEVRSRLREFDVVVLASPRAYNTRQLRELIARVGRGALPRLVMMDGEDYTSPRWDFIQEFRPGVYFKLSHVEHPFELYPAQRDAMKNHVRIVSFPLVTTFATPLETDKTIDVCFLGGGNWHGPRREGVAETRPLLKPVLEQALLHELPGTRIVTGNVPYEHYQETLSASRIAICVSGHGLEPVRTYEAMTCPGTMVVREALPQLTPWPLVDGDTCATFTSHEQIPSICRRWLSDEDGRRALASRGNVLAWAHYTPRARGQQLLHEALR